MRQVYREVMLKTNQGMTAGRYYQLSDARAAVIWLGGVGGGWDTPARELYPRLCETLLHHQIASLRIRFRHSTLLDQSVLDVLAGLD